MIELSVIMPTYKAASFIEPTLKSIFKQKNCTFELVITNDSPEDHEELESVLKKYPKFEIRLIKNPKNLGYPLNVKKAASLGRSKVLFFMCQDDIILSPNTFARALDILSNNRDIGGITRPYYWYENDLRKPNRRSVSSPYSIIDIHDRAGVEKVIQTVGQLSGLVMKRDAISVDFGPDTFTAHIYPFLSILKKKKIYFWPEDMIAVWAQHSQTKWKKSIYRPSPTLCWIKVFHNVFHEDRYRYQRQWGVQRMAQNHLGLLQIRNFGYYSDLLWDIYYLVRYYPRNIISPKFWAFTLTTLLCPRYFLRRLVSTYKNKIMGPKIRKQFKIPTEV